MRELGVAIPENTATEPGTTSMYIARDGALLGAIEARDTLRASAAATIAGLRRLGIRTAMLTGDTRRPPMPSLAPPASTRSGPACFPIRSSRRFANSSSRAIASPWPATASTTPRPSPRPMPASPWAPAPTSTREAGDAILLHGEPRQILDAVLLARQALRVMRQNLGWAFGYNLLGIPIAAGVLYPAFGILLSPAIASAAMALSSVSVLSNSLRLRRFTPR